MGNRLVKPIRIYRHDESVGAGYLLDFLKQHKFEYELVAIDQGDFVTDNFNNVSALVFLGSDSNINDSFLWIKDEIRLIQQATEQKFPIFGHCFGAQLISKALGEEIVRLPRKEIGWFKLEWVDTPVAQEWFGHFTHDIQALHWHGYSLTIPKSATPLFGTKYCPDQAFIKNNIVATTAHVEVTPDLLKQWVTEYGHELMPTSQTVHSGSEIIKNVGVRVTEMQLVTDVLYERWLNLVKRYHSK